ncbi:MAG: ATP-binding cassette domain-containing protein [Sporomusaceae bacterium]|nr:ATP-binding cassette domain-containing protein [Sporomusaceae bacterium]
MATSSLIAADNLTFRYRPGNLALDGATLAIPAGARVALVGPNGAGKSTLFLHINAILRPLAGQLCYMGQPYRYNRDFLAYLRQKVGLVFQDPDTQLFAGNVLDDAIFGPMNMGLTAGEAVRRAEAALEAVGMLDHKAAPVHFLSQGQKKRVAIAGVLAMDPDALVMDEPTAGLDYPGLTSLSETLAMLHAAGKTLLVATHDVDWAWNWADLVYVLAGGRTIAAGSPSDILARADHADLGFARPVLAEVAVALGERSILPAGAAPRTAGELAALLAERKGGQ